MARRYRWVSPVDREGIVARVSEGVELKVVARAFGTSYTTVRRIRDEALLARRRVAHSPHRLSFEERERIMVGVLRGESDAQIARAIGRHRSTVGRELVRCGQRHRYRALTAERRSRERARRPKPSKLQSNPRLLGEVERGLLDRCSPQQISARLRREFPDDPGMRISHETIYLSLFVQGRGELRRELARCLRSGRSRRRAQGRPKQGGPIADMVMISQRPAEAEDRAVPGHWEGDLLMGKANRSQIATLVERSTRFVMLAALDDRTAPHVAQVLSERIQTLPGELRRSLTWDQGKELSEHKQFSVRTGVPVYFCDPRSPWQRGSNENTNGLLRQYFPKGTDLSAHTQAELDQVADQLNRRPRKTLDWLTPAEKMSELLTRIPAIIPPRHPNTTP